ncbi:tRNA (adenosine(37)-N6)-threonylcarbamoyltransferase complex dimerization subunit type 1 TsaB [Namhaeicola litoreus]|uniref:tRNA (Adenosine(37)-N6)-threonylcarbamoyltransferase complex dimerization subunit type 1 TsaB n=1 Tax=Namhaeicola litoreus TaxID=1052145 RepID=A0ABW3XY93_9FLAO
MGIILNIETATKNCSVSLAKDGQMMAFLEQNEEQYSHAEKLHLLIEEVLLKAGLKFQDLDAIGVSKGPGSYTGLRIGVSAAKGLCFALDKPLIAIPTLDVLAQSAEFAGLEMIVPLLDARRMEVYSAVFNKSFIQIRETKAEIITEESFAEELSKGKVVFLGDGAKKVKEILTHENAYFLANSYPSAQTMCMLSEEKYKKKDFEDLAYFEPYYLKDFIAGKPKIFF